MSVDCPVDSECESVESGADEGARVDAELDESASTN